MCWGTNSGIYIYTNYCPATQTNVTLSNLATNEIFFFAVQSVAGNGICSLFSNEAIYTNGTGNITGPPAPPGTNSPVFPGNTNITPSTVTLAWDLSAGASLIGYNVCWGTNSRTYIYTNYCPAPQTSVTLSNLATNEVFFFAVQSVASNGTCSAFSNETIYTNGDGTLASDPPFPPGTNSPISPVNTNLQVNGGNSNGSGTNSSPPPSTNITQSTFWGIPPFLSLVMSNGQANLNISGTVGATLTIMGTTNYLVMDSWSAMTNVTVSNMAPIAETLLPGQAQDLLDVAFVPGAQTLALGAPNAAPFQYFRVVMPYDYVILADQVLPGKGYTPRLIVVNMPGIVCDDACYVNETSSFIHYTRTNSALQLIPAGSTIRAIAASLANSMSLDWTSASEFTWSNGMGQLLATVIETESPASDPVAGQNPPGPPIVIDF